MIKSGIAFLLITGFLLAWTVFTYYDALRETPVYISSQEIKEVVNMLSRMECKYGRVKSLMMEDL